MLPVNRRYCIILFVMKTVPKYSGQNQIKKKRHKKKAKNSEKNKKTKKIKLAKQLSRDAQVQIKWVKRWLYFTSKSGISTIAFQYSEFRISKGEQKSNKK